MKPLIFNALAKAIDLHERQTRKDGTTPYIVHPVATGIILARAGADDEQIAAGILHDTIEDTEYTSERLLEDFGQRVHDMVMACTEHKNVQPWLKRKEENFERLMLVEDAKIVRAADVLANMTDLVEGIKSHGPEFLARFHSSVDDRVAYFERAYEIAEGKMPDEMRQCYQEALAELKKIMR